MGYFSRLVRVFVLGTLVLPGLLFAAQPDPGQISISVARWLEQGHYSRAKLDSEMSQKFLLMYLTTLDYNKLYFTQKDVDEFTQKYGNTLGENVLRGDVAPARDIFARFKQRVEERMANGKAALQKDYKFDSKRVVDLSRQDAAWPKDEAEANRLWQDRIEAELLKETLADVKIRTPKETVARRYDQVLRDFRAWDDEDVIKRFLSALAQTYDPHSEYLSPEDLKNFQISMKLSLIGVGAVLSSEDGYAKVKEVVAGGPAAQDGRLKANDRIAAVAQGNGEFEDVVDMKLDKVVEKIRGKKGTTVRLMVIPADATDPAKRNVIDIVRDEVKLKEQAAKAEIIDMDDANGKTSRIGWITLPSFYANMDNEGSAKSTTEDVAALIGRLKREGIQGLVIDLRRDGGGSLEEAINLTGLFIPRGPVVQAKDPNGKITVSQDNDPGVAYAGPLVVVMNRQSASASEIFAAALQDYGRALIVGDERSFGKGTVQTVLKIGQLMPFFSLGGTASDDVEAGALKLTIQKFYRVKGGSTQLKGVESDIVLPSLTDNIDMGEGYLKHSLAYDEVAPVKIADSMSANSLFLDEIKARSATRIAADPEFAYVREDVERFKDKIKSNTLSLNEADRRKEMTDDKDRLSKRDAERTARGPALNAKAFEVTLDDLASPKLRSVAFDRLPEKSESDDEEEKKPAVARPDAIRNEALRITKDLVDLNKQAKTASLPNANPATP